ncbi:MAG: hypothetical protein GX234_00265 [Clostridiales bacterium]|nr:hypothetical protein [Clostridiales bacterium]
MKNEDEKKYLPTKVTLTIRALVGGYLLYTAYSLLDALGRNTGQQKLFFAVFIVLFVGTGGFLVIQGVRGLVSGKYVGGAMDTESISEDSQGEETSDEVMVDETDPDQ